MVLECITMRNFKVILSVCACIVISINMNHDMRDVLCLYLHVATCQYF